MLHRQQSKPVSTKSLLAPRYVIGAFLIKLAKHLALIACLMIMGEAIGRFAVSQLGIFLTVLSAALLHSVGRVLQVHRPLPDVLTRFGS